jgi:hypothetical protein
MKIKQIVFRMSRMCAPAWYIFRRCLQLAAFLLACALLLTIGADGGIDGVKMAKTASALNETAEAVLLLGALLPVIVEDQQSKR